MTPIIDPISREIIESELTPERLLRKTNNAGNLLYVLKAEECPNTMLEIGRLREWSFREAGGGTGMEVDIDESDTASDGYIQLIVWDPIEREIIGGYRYIISRDQNTKYISTENYFKFSDKFRKEYLPYTIELGRSFVQPKYQGTRTSTKGIYALDNLWDGLGALMSQNPDIKYFLGKVTMYGEYNKEARNLLIYFLDKYFADNDNLLTPIYPIEIEMDTEEMSKLLCNKDYTEDYKVLNKKIRSLNENVPPLINSYMSLSPSMKVFGTVCNPHFGNVEETGILITINDVYPQKIERHTKGM